MEKKKSKTNLLQKFAEKFKKKKRSKSASMSRERGSEMSRRPRRPSRSASKTKVSGGNKEGGSPNASAETKSKIDLLEVTAKGIKSKESKEKKSSGEKKKEKQNIPTPTKTPSTMALRRTDSQMEVSQNNRCVEKQMKIWIDSLEKMDIRKVLETEYEGIEKMKADAEKCQVFEKKLDQCSSESIELLDANRVKGGGEDKDFFYHGSVLNCPTTPPKTTILAQLPLIDNAESLESFWLMVAAQKIQRIYVLAGEEEFDKKQLSDYFPDDFKEHKTIRVNHRKTLPKTDDQLNNQLYYEVVPKDCAEAPFCMVEICDFWDDGRVPVKDYARIATTAASVFDSDIDADASCGIVSFYGAGRTGAFLVGALAIEKLRSGEQPNYKDLGTCIRSQRPGAIEVLSQYIFSHTIGLTYGMKHCKDAGLKTRIEKLIAQFETLACAKMAEEEEEDSSSNATNSNTCE
ncbi:hypothetical protein CRE_29478 [Caenorhabditis remanei]|uniref:Tyrosine-protein phosphatase domain-containing protein n=1 Tax=Caenorhabditis remanei TaxID=31234 RepID=E3LV94_CAERE|nr:hypothetical protein CRE_29478 [Caenorhabditis remanei]